MSEVNFEDVAKELNIMFAKKPRNGQKRNIIFWYNGDGKFKEMIPGLQEQLKDAEIVIFSGSNSFNLKYQIEVENPEKNYLVYVPSFKPAPAENYLLDMYMYSQEFEADVATIYMRELGIKNPALFETVKKYENFFGNQKRISELKKLGITNWTEQTFNIGAFCSVVKCSFDFDYALIKLISDFYAGGSLLESVEKYCDVATLNEYIHLKFGLEDALSDIEKMTTNMLLLHMSLYLQGTIPENWSKNLPDNMNASIKNNAYIFVDRFMKSDKAEDYKSISKIIAEKLDVFNYISGWDMDSYEDVDTFIDFDIVTISRLQKLLLEKGEEYERYMRIVKQRRKSYWNSQLSHDYMTIHYACRFLAKMHEVNNEFNEIDPKVMFEHYVESYYKFDQYYREFVFHYDQSTLESLLDVYKLIDNYYTNWYLEELSNRWSNINDDYQWGDVTTERQWNFYDNHIGKLKERVAVIVSDALRYECGEELTRRLSHKFPSKTSITPALSTMPSYTALGSVALLPHNSIDYRDDGAVLLDDQSIVSYDSREKHLNEYRSGKVYSGKDFLDPSLSQQIRAEVKGVEVIYIYHDRIDAVGDNVPTEMDVFNAAEKCFDDIEKIFQKLQNMSIYNVFITSDHGFLYRREDMRQMDKTPNKFAEAILSKRRFFLAHGDSGNDLTRKIPMDYLIHSQTPGQPDLVVEVPYGTNIFPKQGESKKYMHGGDALQEVVIPIIKIENKKKDRAKNRANQATVKLISISRKITSLITFLEFFQNEEVDDKTVPCNYEAYFVDSNNEQITNSIVINCDSKSKDMADRTYKEKFTFKNKKYSSEDQYYLVIKNYDDAYAEEERIPFVIDILFSNKFNF